MSAQTLENVQIWQRGNVFTLTFRGHWEKIPDPTQNTILLSELNALLKETPIDPTIAEVTSDQNFNLKFDSFYAPLDFRMKAVSIKTPFVIPNDEQMEVTIKVDGGIVEILPIPAQVDHNIKQYQVECDFTVWEDSFVEIEVAFTNYENFVFNEHNLDVSITGCAYYEEYLEIFTDNPYDRVKLVITENVTICDPQTVQGVALNAGDLVIVAGNDETRQNGVFRVAVGEWTRESGYETIDNMMDKVLGVEGTSNTYGLNALTLNCEDDQSSNTVLHMKMENNSFGDRSKASNSVFGTAVLDNCDSKFGIGCLTYSGTQSMSIGGGEVWNFWRSNFTFETWYKIEAGQEFALVTDDKRTLFNLGGLDTGRNWRIYVGTDITIGPGQVRLYFEWYDDSNVDPAATIPELPYQGVISSSAIPIPVDTWVHLAVSRVGNDILFFAHGQVAGIGEFTGSIEAHTYGDTKVGSSTSLGGGDYDYLIGKIDELRIISGQAIYDSDFDVPTKDFCPFFTYDPEVFDLTWYGTLWGVKNIPWTEGENWWKTNVHLQNRSGNDILVNRSRVDEIKSTQNFLIQGINVTLQEDFLIETEKLPRNETCFSIDVLVNGKTVLPALNMPRPLNLNNTSSNDNVNHQFIDVTNNVEGYPVFFGDTVTVIVYFANEAYRYNGKIASVELYGCSPDCAVESPTNVSVFEPCEEEATNCQPKYNVSTICQGTDADFSNGSSLGTAGGSFDPNTFVGTGDPSAQDPQVNPEIPTAPDRLYVVTQQEYVLLNGVRIYI